MFRSLRFAAAMAALIAMGLIAYSARGERSAETSQASQEQVAQEQVAQVIPDAQSATDRADDHEIVVYKSPTCGCCENWIDHLREHGFEVEAVDRTDLRDTKTEHGVAPALQSCHTAVIDGYVIEGHVPADIIKRFVAEESTDAGLAVPGMPIGSPGMEGFPAQSYDVFAFGGESGTRIYASR